MHESNVNQAHPTKRKRGGQPGNQNARVHGCYSRALSPAEISEFWQIASQGNAAPEVVVLRLKLLYLIRHEPGNRRAFDNIGRLIVKWYRAQYRLSPRDTRQLKNSSGKLSAGRLLRHLPRPPLYRFLIISPQRIPLPRPSLRQKTTRFSQTNRA